MHPVTVNIPAAFLPAFDELVIQTQAGTREQWLTNVVKRILFDYQMSKDFAAAQQQRALQLNGLWI